MSLDSGLSLLFIHPKLLIPIPPVSQLRALPGLPLVRGQWSQTETG